LLLGYYKRKAMKLPLFALSLLLTLSGFAQDKINRDVNQIVFKTWSTPDGLPYMKGPGVNLGVTSFQVVDDTRIAFLDNAGSEITLVNRKDNSILDRLPIVFAPRDFVYDHGSFYVLYGNEIVVYSVAGRETARYPFDDRYRGTERLTRYNNATYLLLPSGNSCMVQNDNETLKSTREYEGWITQSGNFIATKINENAYTVKIITPAGKAFTRTFTTHGKAAGAFVVGCTANRVAIDVQTFLSEAPVSVERKIVSIEFTDNGLGDILNTRQALTCYYVLSHRDWEIEPDNTVYNMVTSPDGLFLFSLTESKSTAIKDYPPALLKMRYHFNNNLVKVD
jgi:hypothetical protein